MIKIVDFLIHMHGTWRILELDALLENDLFWSLYVLDTALAFIVNAQLKDCNFCSRIETCHCLTRSLFWSKYRIFLAQLVILTWFLTSIQGRTHNKIAREADEKAGQDIFQARLVTVLQKEVVLCKFTMLISPTVL